MTHHIEPKSALILIEYQNDWLAPTGGINSQFQDREQIDAERRRVLLPGGQPLSAASVPVGSSNGDGHR